MLSHNIKFFTVLFVLSLSVSAQQGSVTSGNISSSGEGSVSYSIGQVVYNSYQNTSGRLDQGLQQVYEESLLSVKGPEFNDSISVFPNPTENHLILQVANHDQQELYYQLIDLQGRLVSQGVIEDKQTRINTVNLPSAVFIVRVMNEEHQTKKSFKVLKN